VHPLERNATNDENISGSAEQIADALRGFREAGYTQVDLMIDPGTLEAFDALAPVVELLHAD